MLGKIMGFLKKLFGFGPKQIPILKAIITFDEDNNAWVEFEKLHPELKSPEYIRIVLHFYAKMLLIIDPKQVEADFAYNQLLSEIDNIYIANLKNNPNILKIADIDDVVKISRPRAQYHRYVATLFAISGVIRHITTDIPLKGYLQHMAFGVPILIHGVLQYLDGEEIEILQLALKWMNEQYRSGADFRDMRTWESVPINAFLSGMMSDDRESVKNLKWCNNCKHFKEEVEGYDTTLNFSQQMIDRLDKSKLPCDIADDTISVWKTFYKNDWKHRALYPKDCGRWEK